MSSKYLASAGRGWLTRAVREAAQAGKPRLFADLRRPSTAPKVIVDIKHIRENAELHAENCRSRNYEAQSHFPGRINELFARWQELQQSNRRLRERSNLLRKRIAKPSAGVHHDDNLGDITNLPRDAIIAEAKKIKNLLSVVEEEEAALVDQMQTLAFAIPNLTAKEAPVGSEPRLLTSINADRPERSGTRETRAPLSHIDIGAELGIIDFVAAGTTSGWGWYYLLDEGAQLEQALVQYALTVATRHGWRQVAPPSMVYSHMAAACGFQPRDQNNEQQIYSIARDAEDVDRGRPELCLAGTSEIPLASMKANSTLDESQLPMKRVAVSRCYRAEAGARGASTRGLYRVHEFTKVEMFAWTPPEWQETVDVFDEMVDMQTEILESLGLHCRVLEMPTTDLGASAARKIDIEAFFPSRHQQGGGWGEVTSASICTDYQSRRLSTRLKHNGQLNFPWTLNGTALAVPRVLAALLETGWDEHARVVSIPECLRPWMDGRHEIGKRR